MKGGDGAMTEPMDTLRDACLIYGPLVAAIVAVLKRLGIVGRFIARHAKMVALLGGAIVTAATMGAIPVTATQWATVAACVLVTFAGSVATHEVALDPAAKLLGMPDPKRDPPG